MTDWRNRITGSGEEAPDQLLANPRNFRRHPKHQQDALRGVLSEVGWVQEVIVNRTTGHLVDGHLRVELALRDGAASVPVKYVDLSEAEEALVLATLDPIGALATADAATLKELLAQVETSDAALTAMLAELASGAGIETETAPLGDPDSVPEPPAEPISKPGDLWLLGEHRVLCGDATDDGAWRALDITGASMVFTSPPYGVGVNARIHQHYVPGSDTLTSLYADHDDDPGNWPDVMREWTALAIEHVDSIVANVQMLANNKRAVVEWMATFSPHLVDVAVWDKGNGPPQMQRNVLTNVFEWLVVLDRRRNPSRALPLADFHGTVGNVVRISGQRNNGDAAEHAATMPVELADWVIANIGPQADLVVDPFGGTGTTLIAAEQRGKRSALIELSPRYVDVIVRRWEEFTGQTAVLDRARVAA